MNRRNEQRPSYLKWFGNMSVLSDFTDSKSWYSGWAVLKLLNSYFRALGVVAFACNPFTGILIFSAMALGNPHAAIASVMSAVISVLTCKLIQANDKDVCSGVNVFNSILVGSILTVVLPSSFDSHLNINFWVILAVASFITNFVDQGLQTMMAPSGLPVQSVPFNIVATLVFLIFRTRLQGFELTDQSLDLLYNDNETVIWTEVFRGSVCGIGQIYGVGNVMSSILIWVAFFLYSPMLTLMFYVGSITGAVIAVLLNVRPLIEVYTGLWSFNSLLASGAITFFVVPTSLGILLSIVNAIIATSVQAAITPLFMQTSLPVFSYPFNVAVMITLAISLKDESSLKFVQNRTFPEEHFLKHHQILGSRNFEADEETDKPLKMKIIDRNV